MNSTDLQKVLDERDLDALATLLRQHPHLVHHRVECANGQSYTPLQYADRIVASLDAMRLLVEFGADLRELDGALFGCCENHNLDHIQRLLKLGVHPDDASNEGWDCRVLYGLLQTYHRSPPDHLHACVEVLVEAGATFEAGPTPQKGARQRPLRAWATRRDTPWQAQTLTWYGGKPTTRGLFSIVCWRTEIMRQGTDIPLQTTAWYPKQTPTFSDCVYAVRQHLWTQSISKHSIPTKDHPLLPTEIMDLLTTYLRPKAA